MVIPDELMARPQWLCWRREQRGGKATKVPIDPHTGGMAKTNDASTWGSYEQALTAVEALGCDGIGFVFTREDPYAGVDLDDCFDDDGALAGAAHEIVDLLGAYAEVSPSGRGLHCIGRGQVPAGARNQATLGGQSVEVYSRGRFFCMTGNSITNGTPIGDCQPQLEELCQRLAAAAHARGRGDQKLGVGEGRNNELTRRLGIQVAKGVTGADLAPRARELNDFEPPLSEVEAERVLRSAKKWPVGEGEPLVHEAAHAEVLKGEWRGLYRWSEHERMWRRWTGRVWQAVGEPVVVAAAQEVLRQHYGRLLTEPQSTVEDKRLHALHSASCRYASVRDGLAFLKGADGFYTEHEQWDADLDKLNCADGLLDLNTQTLGPHDPAALCTMMTRWRYGDESTTGVWEKQLELGLPSPSIRRQVQRDLGRALSGAVKEHSLPIWYGTGRNTKTTDAEALLIGLGDYAAMAVGNLLMASKYERHPTEIAELSGKRLVFCDEIDEDKELAEARVKDLTGGGKVKRAHFMHRDNFNVKKTFTIVLLVNHLPTIAGTDKGIWDRIREVPWTVSIPFAKQRKQDDVVAELVADGSWMLRWLVAGYADFQANPRWIADEVQAATSAYHAEQDRILGFITDDCEEKPFVQVPKADLYGAYTSWCAANDAQPLHKTDFSKALKGRGIKAKNDGHQKIPTWIGIRLLPCTSPEVRTSANDAPVIRPSSCSRRDLPEEHSQMFAEGQQEVICDEA